MLIISIILKRKDNANVKFPNYKTLYYIIFEITIIILLSYQVTVYI